MSDVDFCFCFVLGARGIRFRTESEQHDVTTPTADVNRRTKGASDVIMCLFVMVVGGDASNVDVDVCVGEDLIRLDSVIS